MIEFVKKQMTLPNQEVLAYLEHGTGSEIMIFVHGNMSSSIHFEPLLKRLPNSFKAFAPDLRGFGDSTYHQPIDSLEDLADDLHDFIKTLKLQNVTLVGWSTGGGVCMAFEAKYPGIAKKMVLIETVSYKGYPIHQKDEAGQPIPDMVYESREAMGLDPVQVLPAQQAMVNKDFDYMHMIWDLAIYSVNKPEAHINQALLEETLKQRNLVDIDWALATFNMSKGHNGYTQGDGSIEKIKIPVLAFWGDKDYVVLEHMVKETTDALGENAIFHKLSDSGHSPLIDCPDFLSSRICEFATEA